MKMTQEQANQLFREGEIEVDGVTLVTVEEGEFEQDYKTQTAELIFTDGEANYMTYITRSGSPFTDWYYEDYGDADVYKVEKREVTVTEWVAI